MGGQIPFKERDVLNQILAAERRNGRQGLRLMFVIPGDDTFRRLGFRGHHSVTLEFACRDAAEEEDLAFCDVPH